MSNKRIALRLVQMLLCGAFLCLFLYPLLHEAGHLIAAKWFGAEIKRFTLGMEPSVACVLQPHRASFEAQRALIALAGPALPMLLCLTGLLLLRGKGPILSFALFLFSCITVLSAGLGIAACFGVQNPEDDIPLFLTYSHMDRGVVCAVLLVYTGLCLFFVVRRRLLHHMTAGD